MTLDEWLVYMESAPTLTENEVNELRKAFYTTGWIDNVKLSKLFEVGAFMTSQPLLQNLFRNVIVDYLINDDDASDVSSVYDVVEKGIGDTLLRNLDRSNFSVEFKNSILLSIEEKASLIESTKLLAAIVKAK